MLTEQQRKNIKNEVNSWTDTLFFYFQEYSGNRGENRYEIADLFIEELSRVCLGINVRIVNEVNGIE